MKIFYLQKGFYQLSRLNVHTLSPKAKERFRLLRAWDALRAKGISSHEASQVLGISRSTLYRWQKRLKAFGTRGLEDRSRRPKRMRQKSWSPELITAIKGLRYIFPAWGKEKIWVLLKKLGFKISLSTCGRIISWLIKKGEIRPSVIKKTKRKRGGFKFKRPWALRWLKGFKPREPGDLVEVDTLSIAISPGRVIKQFTARDVVSRWNVIEVFLSASSLCGKRFLEAFLSRVPFKVKAIKVDGGCEFEGEFEKECKSRGIKLYVVPPRRPEKQGYVDSAKEYIGMSFTKVMSFPLSLSS
jgi:transposase